MRFKRTIAAAAVAIATATTVSVVMPSTSAGADNPTFNVAPFPYSAVKANALGLHATGLLGVPPTAAVSCNQPGADFQALVRVITGALVNANVLSGQCAIQPGGFIASAQGTVANASLFNQAIRITAIDARCGVVNGVASWGGTYGSLITPTNYSTNGSGALVIPNIATLAVNVKTYSNATITATAILVDLLPVMLGTLTLVPAQRIVLGQCTISGVPVLQ